MDMLGNLTKENLFQVGIEYGLDSLENDIPLHDLVGQRTGQTILWERTPECKPTLGMSMGFLVDNQPAVEIRTAVDGPKPSDMHSISFVYCHEAGHIVNGHKSLGAALLGFYTKREAEADAFAYAFLYATVHRPPCGASMNYNDIYQAMKRIYHTDTNFSWSKSRITDTQAVQRLLAQEKSRRKAAAAIVRGTAAVTVTASYKRS